METLAVVASVRAGRWAGAVEGNAVAAAGGAQMVSHRRRLYQPGGRIARYAVHHGASRHCACAVSRRCRRPSRCRKAASCEATISAPW